MKNHLFFNLVEIQFYYSIQFKNPAYNDEWLTLYSTAAVFEDNSFRRYYELYQI